jgi:hypothetical protein
MTVGLLLIAAGCSSTQETPSHEAAVPEVDRPLQLQLAAKRYLQAQLPDARGKSALFLVDRSIEMEALNSYLAAATSLGIFSTSIILESKRDVDTPARILLAYQQNWVPGWVPGVASSFDHVFVGTYWNYEVFLPSASGSPTWHRLPYLTSKHLLSEQASFPSAALKALESSVESSLRRARGVGIEITDAEGTTLSVRDFSLAGSRLERPTAEGQIVVSIYQGLNSPLTIMIKDSVLQEISGGGELGDEFRRIASRNKLTLLAISFGLCPKAALPEDFTGLDWSAWASAWSSMNERSGVVRYKIGVATQKGHSWELANFYTTVTLGGEPLIQKGHLLALDSQEVAAALPEQENKTDLLKELWSPYPKVKAGGDK